VLLDAKTYLGKGTAMKPGEAVTAGDIEGMLKAQGLQNRGLLPGDVLYIYTGWGDNWKDPDTEKFYYTKGPGSLTTAKYIEDKQIVLIALDNPFTIRLPTASSRQGRATGRHTAEHPVCHPPSRSDTGGHISDPERQPWRARPGQGLGVVHDDPAAARAGKLRLASPSGGHRGAGTIGTTGLMDDIDCP
jgi:hypothetical protein